MTAWHRRPQSLAVLAATLFLGSTLLSPAAFARRKARPKKARKPPAAAAAATAGPAGGPLRFKVSNPNITQQLEVIPKPDNTVAFTLQITGGCQRTVTGLAAAAGGEALTGQDELGASYAISEYRYQGKDGCFLSLRIDAKQARRATVGQADCEVACPPVEDLMFRTLK
jgi:hypothetical protein